MPANAIELAARIAALMPAEAASVKADAVDSPRLDSPEPLRMRGRSSCTRWNSARPGAFLQRHQPITLLRNLAALERSVAAICMRGIARAGRSRSGAMLSELDGGAGQHTRGSGVARVFEFVEHLAEIHISRSMRRGSRLHAAQDSTRAEARAAARSGRSVRAS